MKSIESTKLTVRDLQHLRNLRTNWMLMTRSVGVQSGLNSVRLCPSACPLHPGQDILTADDPAEFADETIQLLRAPTWRAELRRTAQELVERTDSWDAVVQPFETVLNPCLLKRKQNPLCFVNNPE